MWYMCIYMYNSVYIHNICLLHVYLVNISIYIYTYIDTYIYIYVSHLELYAGSGSAAVELSVTGPARPSWATAAYSERSGRSVKEVLTQRPRIPFRKSIPLHQQARATMVNVYHAKSFFHVERLCKGLRQASRGAWCMENKRPGSELACRAAALAGSRSARRPAWKVRGPSSL